MFQNDSGVGVGKGAVSGCTLYTQMGLGLIANSLKINS